MIFIMIDIDTIYTSYIISTIINFINANNLISITLIIIFINLFYLILIKLYLLPNAIYLLSIINKPIIFIFK